MTDVANRPSWDEYGLAIAEAVSIRADCTRRKVGAVILDKEHRVIAAGYNGAGPGGKSCLAGECPRGQHYQAGWHGNVTCTASCKYPDDQTLWAHCGCGERWPCPVAVAPGSSYDTGAGSCIATHAEANALLYSDPVRRQGGTMYVTDKPCDGCARLLRNSGLAQIIWPGEEKLS